MTLNRPQWSVERKLNSISHCLNVVLSLSFGMLLFAVHLWCRRHRTPLLRLRQFMNRSLRRPNRIDRRTSFRQRHLPIRQTTKSIGKSVDGITSMPNVRSLPRHRVQPDSIRSPLPVQPDFKWRIWIPNQMPCWCSLLFANRNENEARCLSLKILSSIRCHRKSRREHLNKQISLIAYRKSTTSNNCPFPRRPTTHRQSI